MDNYKLKFENGRNCTIQADNVISFQDKINDAENRFDSECVSINDKPIKKHSLGGFLVGATIGAIVGNSVPAHSVSKTTKGVKQTAKKVTRTVKKQVKKFEGGGTTASNNMFAYQMEKFRIYPTFADRVRNFPTQITRKDLEEMLPDYVAGSDITKILSIDKKLDTDLKKLSEDDLIKGYIYPLIPDKSKGAIHTGIIEYAPNFGGEKAFRIWSGGTNLIPHSDFEKFKKALAPYLDGMHWSIGEKQLNPKKLPVLEKNLEVANLEVVNLGGDRYDGGVRYEVRENGKVIAEGDIVGDHGLTFKGQEYDGLWNLAKGINANLIDGENYYENGGRTPMRKYAISGGGLAEEYIVEATNKDEAIEKTRNALKPIFGNVPKNRFSYRIVSTFEGGGKITDADLNYYVYSTKQVRIAYLGKVQIGSYFSLKDALKEIEHLTMAYPKNEIEKYAIICKDKTFHLGEKEFTIRYENGGSTNDEKYCRVSDDTKKGINEGYVWGEGEMYFETEQGLIDYIRKDILDKESQSLSDEFILKESYDNEEYYYTEWDCDSEIEEQGYYYTEDGTEVEIASKGKKLRTQQMERFEGGGKAGQKYKVFNYSDNLFATDETFKTKALANAFIKEFRKRFIKQGYYKDNNMRKIKPEDIDLLAIPSDFNPFQKFGAGGMSSMGMPPQLAIANEISNKLPATTSAIDKRIAEKVYSDKPSAWEDRGLQKMATGGMVGNEIVFDRWGEHTTGTITETMSNGNFSVSSGMGSYLVEPKQVISISPRSEKVKKGWFFAQGGSTNSGLSWYQDHARHNSAESYERPISERKKFAGGGGVGKLSKAELTTIADDYSYATSSDNDRAINRLLDPEFTNMLLPKYIQAITEWETKNNTSVRPSGKTYSELYPKFAGGGGLKTNKMLSNEQIADFLLSDIPAYKEYIREILIGRLMDSSNARTYWDAWFRGAEWEDLERAEKGIIYKKFAGGGVSKDVTIKSFFKSFGFNVEDIQPDEYGNGIEGWIVFYDNKNKYRVIDYSTAKYLMVHDKTTNKTDIIKQSKSFNIDSFNK